VSAEREGGAMRTTASQIEYRYNMIEDYVLGEWPPLASQVRESFLALQPPTEAGAKPVTELLTVSQNNSLMRFTRAPESSSGWDQEERVVDGAPDGQPITKLIAFYEGENLFALAHYAAQGGTSQVLGMQKTPDRGWAAMPMSSNLTNALGAMRQTAQFVDATGRVYVYGISENLDPDAFVILAADEESKEWGLVWEAEAEAGATYRLLPGQDGNDITVMTIKGSSATFRGGSVVDGMFVWGSSPSVTHDLGHGELAARQVFPIPAHSSDTGFLLLAEDGSLFHISGIFDAQPAVIAMTGATGQPGAAQDVSVGLDSQQCWMIFMSDQAASRLWLLRQAESTHGGSTVLFNDWVHLGNQVQTIACPAVMTVGPELFFYDLEARVSHMAQELRSVSGGSTWFTTTLATPPAPETAPNATTTYTQEVLATDANGLPVPGAPMSLYADRKTVIVANGLSFHVGPEEPAEVASDRHGIVTVSSGATALSAPRIRAVAPGFSPDQKETYYRADLRVHQRLAGQEKGFPVTGESLQQAGMLPSKVSSDEARSVATQLRALGAAAVHKQGGENGAAPSSTLPDMAFELDFSTPGAITGRKLVPGAHASAAPRADTASGFFGHVVGDVIHFFKHAADEVEKIAVEVEAGVVTLTINGIRWGLNSVSEIADAIELVLKKLETLFKKIVDLTEMAIEWLRLLLELKSIMRTKEVLKFYLEHGIEHVAADLNGALPAFLDKKLGGLRSSVDEKLGELQSIFGSQTFDSQAGKSSLAPLGGGPPLEATGLHQAYKEDAVRCNFVRSRAERHMGAIPATTVASQGSGGDASFQDLLDAFGKAFPTDQLQAKFQKMEDLAKGFQHASTFLETAIVELLEALEELFDFVLDGIKAVLDVLSQMAGHAVTMINEVITAKISIPIISWLYHELTGSELTILDLFCLILAAPVTFLYQAFNAGAEPFSAEDVSTITSQKLPWPAIPTGGSTAGIAPQDTQARVALPKGVTMALAFTTGVLWLVYGLEDVLLDVALANETGSPPPLVGLALVLTGGAIQLFGAPWDLFLAAEHSLGADGLIAAWAFAWLPIVVDGVVVMLSAGQSVTRFLEAVGPWVDTVMGTMSLAAGVVAVALMGDSTEFKVTDRITVVLPNFPIVCKPLALIPEEVGLVAIGVVDFAGDMGTGAALMIGQAEEG
jgi:hypothetical protein